MVRSVNHAAPAGDAAADDDESDECGLSDGAESDVTSDAASPSSDNDEPEWLRSAGGAVNSRSMVQHANGNGLVEPAEFREAIAALAAYWTQKIAHGVVKSVTRSVRNSGGRGVLERAAFASSFAAYSRAYRAILASPATGLIPALSSVRARLTSP